jgi:hypothetical protein
VGLAIAIVEVLDDFFAPGGVKVLSRELSRVCFKLVIGEIGCGFIGVVWFPFIDKRTSGGKRAGSYGFLQLARFSNILELLVIYSTKPYLLVQMPPLVLLERKSRK